MLYERAAIAYNTYSSMLQ
uniref:Uncharacterized protein n=1 Tax=Anguilla anguilla TaxID=7936 RepID=A0A0E9TKP9_ANGAN